MYVYEHVNIFTGFCRSINFLLQHAICKPNYVFAQNNYLFNLVLQLKVPCLALMAKHASKKDLSVD